MQVAVCPFSVFLPFMVLASSISSSLVRTRPSGLGAGLSGEAGVPAPSGTQGVQRERAWHSSLRSLRGVQGGRRARLPPACCCRGRFHKLLALARAFDLIPLALEPVLSRPFAVTPCQRLEPLGVRRRNLMAQDEPEACGGGRGGRSGLP